MLTGWMRPFSAIIRNTAPNNELSGVLPASAKVLQNVWLGGRDSNPDTQIQSSLQGAEGKEDQRLEPADQGEPRQNAQRRRNKRTRNERKRLCCNFRRRPADNVKES